MSSHKNSARFSNRKESFDMDSPNDSESNEESSGNNLNNLDQGEDSDQSDNLQPYRSPTQVDYRGDFKPELMQAISMLKDFQKERDANGESLSKFLVRNGYAFAYRKYSKKFIKDEEFAKENKLGIWSMKFEYPWNFRKDS